MIRKILAMSRMNLAKSNSVKKLKNLGKLNSGMIRKILASRNSYSRYYYFVGWCQRCLDQEC